jgi:hypothetical protein
MGTSSRTNNPRNPITALLAFLKAYSRNHTGCSKTDLARATAEHFALTRERSVYARPEFAIRFSTASGTSFSNVVLSLSALQKYDHTPFIVCVVRPAGIQLLLANTTFLRKISHSSHQLTIDNVRGSFLGHDIVRSYSGLNNEPSNFDALFSMHAQKTWDENLERLVAETNAIAGSGIGYTPSQAQSRSIIAASLLAQALSTNPEYAQLYLELTRIVEDNRNAILEASQIDNVNLRGNAIEQMVTQGGNFHSVEDASRTLRVGTEVKIDIKTKILTLASSPKGYNIDKTLKGLSDGNTVVSFFFIGINPETEVIKTCLVSIFDRTILNATRVQFHWAGRNSRGVTQLAGDLHSLFQPNFVELIEAPRAQAFLRRLIDLKPPSSGTRAHGD